MSFFSLGGRGGDESWRDHVYGQRSAAIWIFVIILLAAFFYWSMQVPVRTTEYPAPPREIVWANCVNHISTLHGQSPALAEPYNQTSISALPEEAYRANITYDNNINFRCTLQKRTDGTWKLINLIQQ
jgi:hypothetical protein